MHQWWGGEGEEQVHNVDYDPVKTVGGGGGEQVRPDPPVLLLALLSKLAENLLVRHNGHHGEQRKSKREKGDVYTTRVQMALTLAV
jgi:hypothetical protein